MRWQWDWRKRLFKPHILVISNAGAVFMDQHSPYPQLLAKPAELLGRLENLSRPFRIFIDAVEHIPFCKKLPPLSFWDRARVIRNHLKSYTAEDKLVFHFPPKVNSVKGVMVESTGPLQQWLEVLDKNQGAIEGIYSLPFEICRLAKDPQMMVLPTAFKETRFIFSDGKGGIFCRFLPSTLEASIEQQIAKTLQYVCREFHFNLQEVRVLSSQSCSNVQSQVKHWQPLQVAPGTAENFLFSMLELQGTIPKRQQLSWLQKGWWNYLWPRFFIPLSIVLCIMLAALSLKGFWDIKEQQQQIVHLQEAIQNVQEQIKPKDIVALETKLKDIQIKLGPFTDLYAARLMPLVILRKLIPLEGDNLIQIAQLSMAQIGPQNQVRLLLECTIRDRQVLPEDSELLIKNYVHFLATQFPQATLKLENHNEEPEAFEREDVEPPLYRATIQLEGIQP